MTLSAQRLFLTICLVCAVSLTAAAQVRKLDLKEGGTLTIVNKHGRVAVTAIPPTDEETAVESTLEAVSTAPVSEAEVKIAGGRVTVAPADKDKRIDLLLKVPERLKIKVETAAGAIEISGDLASVEAVTDTGTIVTDVPVDDLKYSFLWTQSKPRYLADLEIEEVKEKSAGRFIIKGRYPAKPDTKTKDQKPNTISLEFTTARGIILLNVPPNEVMSDLRERPLTEAAKAIIRSGDSLLTEAIRRASPKYFGDYLSTLPPVKREPTFAKRSDPLDVPNAAVKTATVRVTDLQNRAIAGLTAADLEVTESGQPREILSVMRSTAPVNLVLLLDVSGSVENYVNFIRKAARNFVETVDDSDRVSIVLFNEDVKKLADFTTNKNALSQSLDTFDAGGGTAYYDALAYTVADTLRPLRGERSAVVILTDGDDNRSFLAFDSLTGAIQEGGALIYPLYVPSGLIAAAETGQTVDPMRAKYMSVTAKSEGEGERLAAISGGVYYPIRQISEIQLAYEDIVAQLRSAYLVTYRSEQSANGNGGVSPKLKVRSKRENSFVTVTSVVAGPASR